MKNKTPEMEHEEIVAVFEFLDELRDSGVTNMFDSSSFIIEEFNVNKERARELLMMWAKSFDTESTMEQRMEVALK